MNNYVADVLRYHTSPFADKLPKYDEVETNSTANWAERLQVQIEDEQFDLFDLISTTSFYRPSSIKLACNTNGFHEGTDKSFLNCCKE